MSTKGFSTWVTIRGITPNELSKRTGVPVDTLRKKYGAGKYDELECLIDGAKSRHETKEV